MPKLSSYEETYTISALYLPVVQNGVNLKIAASTLYKSGSATINFASVADNASSAASNVTVTGAVVGDFVVDVSANGDIATTDGVFLLGKVTAADTVEVTLHNDSGGAFDAASQVVNVLIMPKSVFGL